MPLPLLLSIDCGTQSIRALVFDTYGKLHGKAQLSIDEYFSEQTGWCEQHVDYLWDALCRVCHQLWDETDIRAESISGISVTTQRSTVVCLDQHGQALRPAIIWKDQREATRTPRVSFWWNALFKCSGVSNTVEQFIRDAEINWLNQHQPEIVERTEKYLLLSGYFNYRLSGEFKDSVGSQVGYLPFDYKRQRWAKPNDWKWQACPLKLEQLPELVPVGRRLGLITKAAHQQTGLPEGLPIIASAADKACETLGCGAIQPARGQISYGTAATLNGTYSRYVEPVRFLPAYPAAMPNYFNTEFQIHRGYWMVNWFKEQFGAAEQFMAKQQSTSAEKLLDQQALSVPPGCDGLLLQPYWSPGIRHPGSEARGGIWGFRDLHTRAHIYRAILEGVAFGLYEGKLQIEQRSGTRFTELMVSGGGSQSDIVLQITADIFNLPVKVPIVYETSGLGAAINVAIGLGLFSDYQHAVNAMCHSHRAVQPIPENVVLYRDIYQKVYRKAYARLKPLYRQIARLF